MARREFKRTGVWIIWIIRIANDEVSVAAVHNHRVETQNATVTGATDRAFLNRATAFVEKSIHDLHLRDEASWINHEIRLSAVVIHREDPQHTGPL